MKRGIECQHVYALHLCLFPLQKSQVQRLAQISATTVFPSAVIRVVFAWNFPFNDVVDDFRVLLKRQHNCVTLFTHKSHPNVFISTFIRLWWESRVERIWEALEIITHLEFISMRVAREKGKENVWKSICRKLRKLKRISRRRWKVLCSARKMELGPINHENVILLMWKNLNTFIICISAKHKRQNVLKFPFFFYTSFSQAALNTNSHKSSEFIKSSQRVCGGKLKKATEEKMLDAKFSFFLSRSRALNKVKIIKRFNERYLVFSSSFLGLLECGYRMAGLR